MLLHPDHPPAPHDLWQTWSWEPAVLFGLVALGSVYGRGAAVAAFLGGMARLDRSTRLAARTAGMLLVCVALAACGTLAGCGGSGAEPRTVVVGGDPERGRTSLGGFGCGSCHVIPGVRGANGMVGPPLTGFAGRAYIAGQLANQPDNLVRWIQDPQAVEPGTAMPNLGVVPEVARDMAAYLYTLR
jgi:cytochrome c